MNSAFEYLNSFTNYNNLIAWYPKPGKTKDNRDKIDKVPCVILDNPDEYGRTFYDIDHTDKRYHMSVENIIAWVQYGRERYGVDFGVGLSLSTDDPYVFVDYDKCLINGAWNEFVTDAVQRFAGAFLEVSYSGTGLHVIGSASLDPDLKTRCKGFPGEIYSAGRFVALTGNQAAGNPLTSLEGVIQPYMSAYGFEKRTVTGDAGNVQYTDLSDPRYTFEGSDDDLLHTMQRSSGGDQTKFGEKIHVWQLFTADLDALSKFFAPETARDDCLPYDRSRACQALMTHLAYWTGKNTDRMQRLFRRSALYDQEHHTAHGDRHIRLMIDVSNNSCSKVYDILKKTEKTKNDYAGDGFLTVGQQIDHFAGCVYVVGLDRVLTPDGLLCNQSSFNSGPYGGFVFQMDVDNQGGSSKKAWEAFTMNRSHRFPKARGIYFDPGREPGYINEDGNVNTWVPPIINTAGGDPSPFIGHIRRILPNGDDAEILLTWMQAAARYTDKKIMWSPVIQGAEGNGKTIIAEIMKRVIGNDYFHIARPEHIGKEQNGWLKNKRLVFVEEIHTNDRRELLDALKPIISNKHVEIRDMGIKGTTYPNFANLMFFTNHKDAIPVNVDSRRYCILYTAQQSLEDMVRDGLYDRDGETSSYFSAFVNWLENQDGYNIVNNYLLNAPIQNENYDPVKTRFRAPKTTSTESAYLETLTGLQRDILDAINEVHEIGQNYTIQGARGFRGGWIDTAYISEMTGTRINTKTLNKTLKELGYEKITRASTVTCNGIRGNLYYKGDLSIFQNMNVSQITQQYKRVGNNDFDSVN